VCQHGVCITLWNIEAALGFPHARSDTARGAAATCATSDATPDRVRVVRLMKWGGESGRTSGAREGREWLKLRVFLGFCPHGSAVFTGRGPAFTQRSGQRSPAHKQGAHIAAIQA
jgi:hypothetical protein